MSAEPPRLFLITPRIVDAVAFAPSLEAAVAASDVACILLRTETRDPGDAKKIVRALAPLAQKHGAACLVDGDAQLAVRADADGVHMEETGDALDGALRSLKPQRIVGIGGLTTRDAAMRAGEADVDYLMFGNPDVAEPHERLVERVAWWAQIFTIPCVGFAQTLAGVGDFARAGAEFVALCEAVWSDPRGVGAAVEVAQQALVGAPEPAQ